MKASTLHFRGAVVKVEPIGGIVSLQVTVGGIVSNVTLGADGAALVAGELERAALYLQRVERRNAARNDVDKMISEGSMR